MFDLAIPLLVPFNQDAVEYLTTSLDINETRLELAV